MQLNNANKFPEFKYIISGQLKMKEISHTGKIIPFCHIKNMKHSVKWLKIKLMLGVNVMLDNTKVVARGNVITMTVTTALSRWISTKGP